MLARNLPSSLSDLLALPACDADKVSCCAAWAELCTLPCTVPKRCFQPLCAVLIPSGISTASCAMKTCLCNV